MEIVSQGKRPIAGETWDDLRFTEGKGKGRILMNKVEGKLIIVATGYLPTDADVDAAIRQMTEEGRQKICKHLDKMRVTIEIR